MNLQPLVVESGVIGRGKNNKSNPHYVYRRDGTSIWLLEYTVKGGAHIRAGGSVFKSEPGDFFIFKPLVTQDYGMDTGVGSWDHIWLSFSPRPHWHDWLKWPEKPGGILVLRMPDRATRTHLLTRMEYALKIAVGMHARRRDFALNVLEEILLACDEWNPAGKAARLDDRIRAALKHLCEHSAEKITLQNLAKVCGLSPSRLSHLFKEQAGETPLQYLEQRRIEAARDLLQMTSKPVSQIAYEVGFNNPFHFSRIYRRKMGIPPSATRQHRKA
jgi:AraC family transcriptional regulator of arabinose operon